MSAICKTIVRGSWAGQDTDSRSVRVVHREDERVEGHGSETVDSVTIVGGRNKMGQEERVTLTLNPGEIICVVGPTGAGKSRLLADIECLLRKTRPQAGKFS